MPKIHCLERHVANLIAAGEVVERPASVVKELTENAIDAGATAVAVEIQRGGMGYIRVTDNGCGMEPEDAETAFLRHATSKIQNAFDLEAIGTLGFRGEALAAIAAVARVELMTRTADREFGTGLTLEGGKVVEREVVGCPEGTTMIVRNLFYNTPARLKFMKRDVAEGAAVYAVVQHVALSHPEVSFRFVREGKEELLTPGDGDLRSAVYAVLGREVALGMLSCKRKDEELSVEGFISRPTCCRGNRSGQHFFVNGRYVKSRTMSAALEQAYQNQKMVGKFPGCVLRVACKLNAVDVNVHPAKTEVKFTSERKLFDAVYYAVKETLEAEQGHPQAELKPKVPPKQEYLATVKNTNYLPNVLMAREAAERGMDCAVTFHEDGTMGEAAVANIGIVNAAGELVCPPLNRILAGTSMLCAMKVAKERMPVRFAEVTRDDIASAREMLLFASSKLCVGITHFDGRPFGDGRPGPVARWLRGAMYKEMVRTGTPVWPDKK